MIHSRMRKIPQLKIKMPLQYSGGLKMCFTAEDYTASWINLRIGIATGCSISAMLLIMVMELILNALHNWTEKH